MQEPLVDHLKEWAREIMEECSPLQVRTIISRYRAKALDPAVDPFSRREFMMRADILDELSDTLSVTAEPPHGNRPGLG